MSVEGQIAENLNAWTGLERAKLVDELRGLGVKVGVLLMKLNEGGAVSRANVQSVLASASEAQDAFVRMESFHKAGRMVGYQVEEEK